VVGHKPFLDEGTKGNSTTATAAQAGTVRACSSAMPRSTNPSALPRRHATTTVFAGSCKGPPVLIALAVSGCMSSPAGSVGGVEFGSEGRAGDGCEVSLI